MADHDETARNLELAAIRVPGPYLVTPGEWQFTATDPDGYKTHHGPYTKSGALKARNRALVAIAAEYAGGLANLARLAMGKDKREALDYLLRRATPDGTLAKRQWSPAARERAARRREERRRNELRNRDAAEARAKRHHVETCHAAARVASARIAARRPSLPPATVSTLARWVADPLV